MFCSSIQRRPVWASLPTTLLSLHNPKWTESNLESHDLQIPVPRPHEKGSIDLFRLILLSAHDMQPPTTNGIRRIEELYHKTGGRDIGVIFLLQEKSPQGNAATAFIELQMSLQHLDVPIIPLATMSNLQTTLSAFQKQLFNSRLAAASAPHPRPEVALLPYCSNGPIPEHARNVLSDKCRSIPDLAQAATTLEGQTGIRQYFSDSMPHVAEDVINFWEQEFIVD